MKVGIVVHTLIPSHRQRVQSHPGLHKEFRTARVIKRPFLKTKKKPNQNSGYLFVNTCTFKLHT